MVPETKSTIVQNSYYAKGAFQSTDATKGNHIAHQSGTVMYGVLQMACGTKPRRRRKSLAKVLTGLENRIRKCREELRRE